MVDGIPITGASAPMAVHSGALAGLTQLRDTIAPEYQAQLDQISNGLVSAFAETDQSATPTAPTLPGLFTFVGATGLPTTAQVTGLSSQIEVNPNVESNQGGSVDLVRDGGISDPGSATYTYNTTGSTGYSGRIRQLASAIGATQSFDPNAGLGASDSLSDYASNSVGWLQGQNQQATDAASYQTSVASQATAALSNRDRRQSGHGDDQYAEHRELLHDLGQTADDGQRHVLGPAERGLTAMAITSISTQYLGTAMIPAVTQAQSQLTTLEVESSTGQYADLGLQLGSQSGYELSLKNEYDQMQSLTTDNAIATTNLSAAQAALEAIRANAQSTLQSLTALTGVSDSASTLQTLGSTSLQALIGSANASSGDLYVFGGINSTSPPLTTYFTTPASSAQTALDQAFQTTFGFAPTNPAASTISAGALQNFLTGPFAAQFSGSNWSSNWSSASSTNTTAEIAPGETIATSSNANQPGFAQLAQAFTMLNEFGGSALSESAQQVLVTTASSLVTQGLSSMTTTETEVGASLGQITQRQFGDEFADVDPADASRQPRRRRRQLGRHSAQHAHDADRDRLSTHRAAAEAQPRAISPRLINVGFNMFEFAYNDIVDDSPQAMRAQEGYALDQVLELLRAAAKAGHGSREVVTALFQLRRLWGIFLDDLSSPENGLPDALRAGIISIGIWVNREIDRIRSGATHDLSPLIEINQIIRDGLN